MPFKNLDVKKIIIHEIYSRTNDTLIPPNYGTELESLDHEALDALNNRITDAMGSAAKNMEIKISESESESCVAIAKQLLNSDDDLFIQLSKKIAEKLTNSQTRRGLPGGILAVFSGTSGFPEKKIVGIIKADTHTGFSRKEKKLIFIGIAAEFGKNSTLRLFSSSQRSELPFFNLSILTPNVIAHQIDVFPTQRRQVLQ